MNGSFTTRAWREWPCFSHAMTQIPMDASSFFPRGHFSSPELKGCAFIERNHTLHPPCMARSRHGGSCGMCSDSVQDHVACILSEGGIRHATSVMGPIYRILPCVPPCPPATAQERGRDAYLAPLTDQRVLLGHPSVHALLGCPSAFGLVATTIVFPTGLLAD